MSKRIAASTLLVSALMLSAVSGGSAAAAEGPGMAGRPSEPAYRLWICPFTKPNMTFTLNAKVLARNKREAIRSAQERVGPRGRVLGCLPL